MSVSECGSVSCDILEYLIATEQALNVKAFDPVHHKTSLEGLNPTLIGFSFVRSGSKVVNMYNEFKTVHTLD